MTKTSFFGFVMALMVLLGLGVSPALADGPYRGKVIDAETKEPIEGAVVVAVWEERKIIIPFVPHGDEIRFREAKETLTDENGEFEITGYVKGEVGKEKFGMRRPNFYIFKAGYVNYPGIPGNGVGEKKFLPSSLVELPKVESAKERRTVILLLSVYSDVPLEKIPNWIRLKKAEQINLGFKPTKTP